VGEKSNQERFLGYLCFVGGKLFLQQLCCLSNHCLKIM
jgi:hypothetical protein